SCPVMTEDVFVEGAAFTLHVNLNGLWRVEFANLDLLALRPELAEWLHADTANRFAQLPQALVRAVLERIFLPVLDEISRVTGMPGIFSGAPRATSRPMFTEHLDMLLRLEGAHNVSTMLRIAWQDTATLMPIVESLEAQPLPTLSRQVGMLSLSHVSARLFLGNMRLTAEELASLNTGDVLLPTNLLLSNPRLRLATGLGLVCDLDGTTLTVRALESSVERVIDGEQQMSDSAMGNTMMQGSAENTQVSPPLLGQDALGKLELDISFELPGLRLPLEECAQLVAGYTITLPAEAAHLPVSVKVGGKVVAMGRLVDVSGTVGVQLTQLTGKTAGGRVTKDGD
ncbi:MAG: FliM/FliN family flagellar motor switch protein, partial [Desulfovibrio sp.]|nr:FliM/FliN family flagellar motor switch protein [Desulfovibrio sp.]